MSATLNRFGFIGRTTDGGDMEHVSAGWLNKDTNHAMLSLDNTIRRQHSVASEAQSKANFAQRDILHKLPDQGFRGRFSNMQLTNKGQQEIKQVNRGGVFFQDRSMSNALGNLDPSLVVDHPIVRAKTTGFGNSVGEIKYASQIVVMPEQGEPVVGKSLRGGQVVASTQHPCTVLVGGVDPIEEPVLMSYFPSDGSEEPRFVRFTKHYTVQGLAQTEYTFLIGSEAPGRTLLIDGRRNILRYTVVPHGLSCNTTKRSTSSHPRGTSRRLAV